MVRLLADELNKRNVSFTQNVSLKKYTTLRIDATAELMVFPTDADELVYVLDLVRRLGVRFKTVGRMSNSIPRDKNYSGVLINTSKMRTKSRADNLVSADAGVTLGSLIRYAAELDLGGGEPLFHIPGSVGGSVAGNAGAHGLEIADLFRRGRFYDLSSGQIVARTAEEMDFSYRRSNVKESGLILLDATLALTPKQRDAVLLDIRRYGEMRKNQPIGEYSLGSTFKRCGNVSAGYYIDRVGLKGFAIGGAEVSTLHAGFIVNRGGATSEDVIALTELIRCRVYDTFGILLEQEIEFF